MHCFFTLMVFALTNAYREEHCEKEALEEEKSMGIRRWREEQQSEARDKAIVFVGEHYGIFYHILTFFLDVNIILRIAV